MLFYSVHTVVDWDNYRTYIPLWKIGGLTAEFIFCFDLHIPFKIISLTLRQANQLMGPEWELHRKAQQQAKCFWIAVHVFRVWLKNTGELNGLFNNIIKFNKALINY